MQIFKMRYTVYNKPIYKLFLDMFFTRILYYIIVVIFGQTGYSNIDSEIDAFLIISSANNRL